MMGDIFQSKAVLEEQVCAACGIQFAAPADWTTKRRADCKTFYCPNGHSLSFGETEADRLKKKIAWLESHQKRVEERAAECRADLEHANRVMRGMKGALAKMKKRREAGQ